MDENELSQRLKDMFDRYGTSLEQSRARLDEQTAAVKQRTASYKSLGPVLDQLRDSISDSEKAVKSEAKTLRQEARAKRAQSRASNITEKERRKLRIEANELIEQSNRLTQDLHQAQQEMTRGMSNFAFRSIFDTVVQVGTSYVKGSAQMASSLISSVQSQADSLSAGTDLLLLELQRNMNMVRGVIDGVENMGGMLGATGKLLTSTLASGARLAAEGFNYLSEEGIKKLSTEVIRTRDNFVKLSNAGGFFAGGMTELRTSANAVGMRMEDYANTIVNAGENLRVFGATQADAMGMVQDVVKGMGPAVDMSLRKLGYSVTDISELTAEYMSNLARTGTLAGMSQEALAKGSFEYMTNLKIISSITGEEAKAAQDRARQASMQSAVFAKLSGMGGNATDQFQALVKMMPGFEKELQQMLLTGASTNAAFVNSPAFKVAQNALGQLGSDVSALDLAVGVQDQLAGVRPELESFIRETSAAGTGAVFGYNSEFSDSLGALVQLRQQSLRTASDIESDIKKQSTTTDGLTNETARLQKNFETASIVIEGRFTQSLGVFVNELNDVTAKTEQYADILMSAMLAIRPAKSYLDTMFGGQDPDTAANATSDVSIREAVDPNWLENGIDRLDAARKKAAEEGRTLSYAEKQEIFEGKAPEFAKGGVVVGPSSGYSPNIVMHGKEAIVPLGDGGVPVVSPVMEQLLERLDEDLSTRGTTVNFDVSGLINKLNEVNETSKMQVEMSKRIVERLETANSVSKQIMQLTR